MVGDGDGHSVELVVACHLLDNRAAPIVLEDDEVPQHIDETAPVEDTREHYL
jgi:hypothetical protein